MRHHQAAARHAGRFAAEDSERRIITLLLSLTGADWRLLVDRDWPARPPVGADVILVGPAGVYVIGVRRWSEHRAVVNDDAAYLAEVSRPVERALAAMQMSPVAVTPVLLFAGHEIDAHAGRVRLLGAGNFAPVLAATPARMQPVVVRAVAAHLAEEFPAYQAHRIETQAEAVQEPQLLDEGLFDADRLWEAALQAARSRPMEGWMTFLHPAQVSLVRRQWGGPARISGAAGTGKTVVGLHRAVYLAQRTTGKVLFATFVNNLPKVTARLLEQLAPSVADRIECTNLHRWAVEFLQQRGVPYRLQQIEDCFSRAWLAARRDGTLAQIDPSPGYWEEEINYVIKGRAIQTLGDYLRLARPGRRTPLQNNHRRAVWALYEQYERLLHERGVHDFHDVLRMALDELRARPIEPAYAAVIVDEVQDMPLIGIQLLHALIGDKPDGLLLIGDNQQSVYPGGFRLAEAGITITGGRAERLDVNYRNAADILDAALAVMDGEPFEDLDGTVISGRPPVELTYFEGQVVRVHTPSAEEHDKLLLEAVQQLAAGGSLADSALLCARSKDVEGYATLLSRAGVPILKLDSYDGLHSEHLKIGTFHRAKGLEFKHVLLPHHDHAVRAATHGRYADADRRSIALRQLYVGMTRARDSLWLGSVE
jgi:superfamily I DNA/RNA helicase